MSVNDSAILTHAARIGIQCNYYVFKLFIHPHPPSLDEIVHNLCLVHIFFYVEALEVSTSYKVLVTRGCVMTLFTKGHKGKFKATGGKNAEFLSRPYLV